MKTAFSRFCRFSARLVLCAGLVLTLVSPGAWAEGDVAECKRLYVAEKYQGAFLYCQRAAEAGDAEAQYALGLMYYYGKGVFQDKRAAVKWFRMAAEQGDMMAGVNLGLLAGQGIADAQYVAGLIVDGLIYDEGVLQDTGEAVRWYRLAAEQGHVEAQYALGLMYSKGEGVLQDEGEAVKWYRLAAEQGHVEAQYALGYMYSYGKGVAQDKSEAANWYRLAANQGYAKAQYNLGGLYYIGKGVAQDKREAARWYRLAAEQGHVEAQTNIGWAYANGNGVIPDPREAFIWYSIAAANGREIAPDNLRTIENQMSDSEIRSARAEAKRRLAAIEAGTYGKESASPPSVATVPKDGSSTPAQTAFENVWRSVVYIQTSDGQGSGVIVRSHIVATNCHVIADASSISVYKAVDKRADKTTPYAATARRYDVDRDVCLLNVAGLFGVSAQFRNADSLFIGENVYAVGAPDGLDLSLSGGIVSQLRRTEGYGAPTVQTDAAISPGSSGGALTDASGRVVAITTSKRVGKNVEGITFAVPIEWVLEMLE